jgi:predicted N-acetyltransferase YhbS
MLRIRPMGTDDVLDGDEVLRAAFRVESSFAPRLRRYLAIQPDGWLLAEEAGQPVGMVGAIDYGRFAYVGMMGVRAERQGQGIGRQLMEGLLHWLEGRGVSCVRLDATDAGGHLYRKLGFVDASISHELHFVPSPARATAIDGAVHVETATDDREVIALDAELFGADRARLWRWLFRVEAERILVARDRDGRAVGYLCAQEEILGPWGARTPAVADSLLRAALPLIRGPRLRAMVPEQNADGRSLLEAHRWRVDRVVPHMVRGSAPPAEWGGIYGKGSYCLG